LKDLQSQGYYESGENGKRQTGIIRSNCIDKLDRTNVAQSVFGREQLKYMLKSIGVFDSDSQKVIDFPVLEKIYKETWADNADAISLQYSGTGALKTDYTRTGKRTYLGTVKDGINSLTRYYLNNFVDGWRQDSIDLVLGNYVPSLSKPSPFLNASKGASRLLILVMFLLALMFSSLLLAAYEILLPHPYLTAFVWLVIVFITYRVLIATGRNWVDRPVFGIHKDE